MKPKSNARPVSLDFACNTCGDVVEQNGKVVKTYATNPQTGAITCHTCVAKNNFPKA